jgi:hypothetical protein
MGRIEIDWKSYECNVISAPDVQRIECRRAFFAGANATLKIMTEAREELNEFVKDVGEGRK